MPRKSAEPFQVRTYTYSPHPSLPGMTRARGRYRKETGGPLLDVYGTGKTKKAARDALHNALETKRERAALDRGGSVTALSTVSEVAQVWLRECETRASRPLAPRTLSEYRKWVAAYIDGTEYGRMSVRSAATKPAGHKHLQAIANGTHKHKKATRGGGEGAMRSARKVMHAIMNTAHDHRAIDSAPKFDLQRRTVIDGRQRADASRAFTAADLRTVQATADEGTADLGDLVAFLSVVGCRISEALAIEWHHFNPETRDVVIPGTKSSNAARTVRVPQWLAERLSRRVLTYRGQSVACGCHDGCEGHLFGSTRFATSRGRKRSLCNTLNAMRTMLDSAGYRWAGSHTFRRTVATMLDDSHTSLGDIATVLGQHPTTTMTYIKRKDVGTASAEVFAEPF